MTELYFEGAVAVETMVDGMVQVANPVQIGDGLENESFVMRLISTSKIRRHPVMDQLAGKKVRMTFTVLE